MKRGYFNKHVVPTPGTSTLHGWFRTCVHTWIFLFTILKFYVISILFVFLILISSFGRDISDRSLAIFMRKEHEWLNKVALLNQQKEKNKMMKEETKKHLNIYASTFARINHHHINTNSKFSQLIFIHQIAIYRLLYLPKPTRLIRNFYSVTTKIILSLVKTYNNPIRWPRISHGPILQSMSNKSCNYQHFLSLNPKP